MQYIEKKEIKSKRKRAHLLVTVWTGLFLVIISTQRIHKYRETKMGLAILLSHFYEITIEHLYV